MNIAMLIAGGSGQRTKQDIPKQFIHVDDKPILIYTMEAFQRHPDIDLMEVVCLDGWQDILKAYAKQFNITKLKWIAAGGASGQESIRNGVFNLRNECSPDDIVIIHDGIRPMVDERVISDCILTCTKFGNAVSSLPFYEQIFKKETEYSTKQYVPRETIRRVQTPQAYKYGKLLWAYEKAFAQGIGIHGSSYTNTMMVDLGETLYFSMGSERNIKITTLDDITLFKAMLNQKNNGWMK